MERELSQEEIEAIQKYSKFYPQFNEWVERGVVSSREEKIVEGILEIDFNEYQYSGKGS